MEASCQVSWIPLSMPNRLPEEGIAHHFTDEKAKLKHVFIKEQMALLTRYLITGKKLD